MEVRKTLPMKVLLSVITTLTLFGADLFAQNHVPFKKDRYQETIKGDMIVVGNSILNVGSYPANTPYIGDNGSNAFIELNYIDVDGAYNGTTNKTRNSSSANVTDPASACIKLRKAVLYWTAAYTNVGKAAGNMVPQRYKNVKFKVPGAANYTELTGTAIFDNPSIIVSGQDRTEENKQRAYVYATEVTHLLNTTNFSGTYTVADIQAPIGREASGVGYTAGWTLFIVYEDSNMPSKHITLFEGFSTINNAHSKLEIPVSGFRTIPLGPVRAKFAFSSLEGELGIAGDKLSMKSPTNSGVLIDAGNERYSTGANPNFFNSKITNTSGVNLDRNPASTNLLGFDIGIFDIPNPGNNLIANNSDEITIVPENAPSQGGQDAFFPFMMAFAVDVIEPKIVMEKRVYSVTGTPADITGQDVTLGQQLQYRIKFRNIGNDDAKQLKIKDKLNVNLHFDDVITNLALPTGVTYRYEPYNKANPNNSHYIEFTIPEDLVKQNSTEHTISFNVKVAENCDEFRDACSNEIKNIASASYFGVQNTTTIPFQAESFNQFTTCDGGVVGPSNFIVDTADCTSKSQAILCGDKITLTAGAGFDRYVWTKVDSPNPNQVIGNQQTIEVTQTGVYRVEKTTNPPCRNMTEEITVVLHKQANAVNPIEPYASEVLTCGNDGVKYPQIYLCGKNSSKNLILNIGNAVSYAWQKRNDCPIPTDHVASCPVYNLYGCRWATQSTQNNFNVSQAGDYRVSITYQNGCVTTYYFKVTKTEIDPKISRRNIICNTPGRIEVTNVPSNYEYALRRNSDNVIVVDYQNSNIFDNITNEDSYTVLIRQKLVAGATYKPCILESNPIQIIKMTPKLVVSTTPLACENSKGSIRVQVADALPPYNYVITDATSSIVAQATATQESDITFSGLNEGTYHIQVTTPDGCNLSKYEEVTRIAPLRVTAKVVRGLMCGTAIIRADVTGGKRDYAFSIDGGNNYVYNYGESFYEFTVTQAQNYTIKVVDANNCEATDNVAVRPLPVPDFEVKQTLRDCAASLTLEIINVTNANGYTLSYSVDGGATTQSNPVFANLNPTQNYVPTLVYSLGNTSCTLTKSITINKGNGPITVAFAGVSKLVGCVGNDKAEVRVTNVQGGTPPYEYSFDNKQTWQSQKEGQVAPGVDIPIFVRDAQGCEYQMKVTIPNAPVNPIFQSSVTYNCEGKGTITLTNDKPGYQYVYSIDGGATTQTSPVFDNLGEGEHTITISYADPTAPTPNILFLEDFGVGTQNVTTPYINPKYFFEPQRQRNNTNTILYTDGTRRIVNGLGEPETYTYHDNLNINDGEYVVSNRMNPIIWGRQPNDRSGNPNGRKLFINVGNVLGTEGAILYQREMKDVIPNQNIRFSIAVFNLMQSGADEVNPDLSIELYTSEADIAANNPLVAQRITPRVPQNTGENDWHVYNFSLNPEGHTTLYAVVRSYSLVTAGNDLVLDDIYLYQIPETCGFTKTIKVRVESDKAFAEVANSQIITNATCFGGNNGSYRITLKNFDTANGYVYSVDGGAWQTSTANPFVLPNLSAKPYNVKFRYDATSTNCEVSKDFTITAPDEIVVNDIPDQLIRCDVTSVSVNVVARGGTGALKYKLTLPDNTSIVQNSPLFTGLTQVGQHRLEVTDANGCAALVKTFEVTAAQEPNVSVAATSNYCYSATQPASITVEVTDGTAPYRYLLNNVEKHQGNDTSYTFNGLTPNTYNIKVIDANGCDKPLTETIALALDASNTTIVKPITCKVAPDNQGKIQVTIRGGYPPYTYTVNGGTPQNVTGSTIEYSTDTPDTYTFEIIDSKGCKTTVARTLAPTVQPTVTLTPTHVNCFGDSTGKIVATVTGGVPPYTYFLNGVNKGSQNTFENLPEGTYRVKVVDAYQCEKEESVTITQPDAALTANVVVETLISCRTDKTAKVTVQNVNGGTPPYQYQFNTDVPSNNATAYLPVGTHQVRIIDSKGCTLLHTVVVAPEPTPPTVNTNPTITYNCDGTGNFTLTPTPATFDYEYSTDGGVNYTTNNVFNNMLPKVHQIHIRYKQNNVAPAEDCWQTISVSVNVESGKAFSLGTPIVEHVRCNGENNGKITISVSNFNNVEGYRYSVDNKVSWVNMTTSPIVLQSLVANSYKIFVQYKKADGTFDCEKEVDVTVTQPNPLQLQPPTITVPVQCNNAGATVELQATGGTSPYQYSKDNGASWQNSNVFTPLSPRNYTFVVKDAKGCEFSYPTPFEVTAPKTITFNTEIEPCYSGNNDATIKVTVTDGNGGYKFNINAGAWQHPLAGSPMTYTFNNLSQGTYAIRVSDAYGCEQPVMVTIHPRLMMQVKATKASCNDGKIEVTAQGGDGTYEYAFVPKGTMPTNFVSTNTYAVPSANVGEYDVYLRSAECTVSQTIKVEQAPAIGFTANAVTPSCYGQAVTVKVTNIVGEAPYTLTIADAANPATALQTVNNYINTSYDFVGISPTINSVEVKIIDRYGCPKTEIINITHRPQFTATFESKATGCIKPNSTVPLEMKVPQTVIDGYSTDYDMYYSVDNGANWLTLASVNTISSFKPGESFTVQIKTVTKGAGATATAVCLTLLDKYKVSYPLSDLIVSTTLNSITNGCPGTGNSQFEVTLTAQGGTPFPGSPAYYEFTMDEDHNSPTANWLPGNSSSTGPGGTLDQYTFTGLIPGRSYKFYVRDKDNCIKENNEDIYAGDVLPIRITGKVIDACPGGKGRIEFTIRHRAGSTMGNIFSYVIKNKAGVPVSTIHPAAPPNQLGTWSGNLNVLPAGGEVNHTAIALPINEEYYMEVFPTTNNQCIWASENFRVNELPPMTATPHVVRGITCNLPGIIEIQNPTGGSGKYLYRLTSPQFTAPIFGNLGENIIEIPQSVLNAGVTGSIIVQVSMFDDTPNVPRCEKDLGTVTINMVSPPAVPMATADSCTEPLSIEVTSPLGNQFEYRLGTGGWQDDKRFTNLTAGNYTLVVRDKTTGCETTNTTPIVLHNKMKVEVKQTKLLGCNGINAEIEIKVPQGSGVYHYEVSGQANIPKTPLPPNPYRMTVAQAGTYTIKVYDQGAHCTTPITTTVVVAEAIKPQFTAKGFDVSCFGASDGRIVITETNLGDGPYIYTITPSTGTYDAASKTFTGLTKASYTITSRGQNGCETQFTVDVGGPDAISSSTGFATVTPFGCATGNNVQNAWVRLDPTKISGGTPPYTYKMVYDNATPANTADDVEVLGLEMMISNHLGGSVKVLVTDVNHCDLSVPITETIIPFDELSSVTPTATPMVCGGTATVTLNVVSTTGTAAKWRFYQGDTPPALTHTAWQTSNSFGGLNIGTYTFWVAHTDTGCMLSTTYEVKNPNNIVIAVANTTQVSCKGTSTGSITFNVTATGYTADYTWQITGPSPKNGTIAGGASTTGAITGLQAGSYVFTATQQNNPKCSETYNFTITEPDANLTAATQVTPISCRSNTDGAIEIVGTTGGWGGYTYYVGTTAPTSVSYVNTPLFNRLGANTYQVWVKDSKNCEQQLPDVVLKVPDPITATLKVSTHNCMAANGSITVENTSGGQGSNYTYQLIRNGNEHGAPQTANVFTGLAGGTYTVRISDTWGCTVTLPATVEIFEPIVIKAVAIAKEVTCNPNTGGTATIDYEGGSTNIRFTVTDGGTLNRTQVNDPTFIGLPAGDYTAHVYDITSGCATTTTMFKITDKVDVTFDVAKADVKCNSANDGSISVTIPVSNTQPPYQVTLNSTIAGFVPQTQNVTATPITVNFPNLVAGNYTVKVVSSRGCEETKPMTIDEPNPLMVNNTATVITPFACSTTNVPQLATITVVAQGGTAPYRYSLDNTDFNNTTGTFAITDTGAAQNFTVYVKDAHGCEAASSPIVINPLPKITKLEVTPLAAIRCGSPERINLEITGGANEGYRIEVTNTASVVVAPQTLLAGIQMAIFDLPMPGFYEFKVTDIKTGCYTTTTYNVAEYKTMRVQATPSQNISCDGATDGKITFEISGYSGTATYQVYDTAGTALAGALGNVPAGTTTVIIDNIPQGNWYVKVTQTDHPLCEESSGVVFISGPTHALTIDAAITNHLTCKDNDATISVVADGGWGDYQYQLVGHPLYGTYTTTTTFTGLGAGNYTVQVIDRGGCLVTQVVTIAPPTPIAATASMSSTPISCFGEKTASIEATGVSGGSGNYQYALITYTTSGAIESAAQTSPIFSGLGAGNYAIKVIDGWNCDFTTPQVTIAEPTPVKVSAEITTNITCLNTLATITLSATGGTPPYTYNDAPMGTFGTSNVFNKGVGVHTFYAKDANGCLSKISNTIEIYPIPDLKLTVDTTDAYVKCNGDSSASIKAKATGGLGNYQYELLDGASASFPTPIVSIDGLFTNLAAGTYHVKVTSVDCEEKTDVAIVINQAPAMVVNHTKTDVTCFGRNDGEIRVEATGGTGEIKYAISPRLDRFEAKNHFDKLTPGNYTVIVQDENGCFEELTFVIAEPTLIRVNEVSVTDEKCLGASDGTATIAVTGGVAPYYTSLNDDKDSADWQLNKFYYDNLPATAGNVIFVKDSNGCIGHVILSEIKPGVDFQATATAQYGCAANVIENKIVVKVNPLYMSQVTYALDGGTPTTDPIFRGVSVGMHTVTIKHDRGCVVELPVEVELKSPLALTPTQQDVSCHAAADAFVSVAVTGGSGNYQYAISPNLTQFGNSNKFEGLSGGTYIVVVRDTDYGCEVEHTFIVDEPLPLQLNSVNVTDESCYNEKDGTLTFEIAGGRANYRYQLVNSRGAIHTSQSGISAGSVITLNNLPSGTYLLEYADSGTCTNTHQVVIKEAPNLAPVTVKLVYECAEVIGNSVTNYLEVVFDNTQLDLTNTTYALNSSDIADARNFSEFNGSRAIIRNIPVGAGQYITIFHNGCKHTIVASQYFNVEDYQPLMLNDTSDARTANQVRVEAKGGAAPYTYYFNGVSYPTNEYYLRKTDPGYVNATGKEVKRITARVVDNLGCEREILIEREFFEIEIPNYFTPNEDGENDHWGPRNTRNYPNIETYIYDRYGRLIVTLKKGETWDGKYKGKALPSGDYWYTIRLNQDDDNREFVGHFTLFR
ncbi:T9SS type B sorting domain-containing protein [Capnocytophaga canimorsus]|uniref:T9SS type B sorting domain-containing protein n=1 Tax=Capnocytophaga canimorsus TaxID=28188 RepID=UPI00384BE823